MNENCRFDIAIIGAGIVGSALAYKLSRYRNRILLLERGEDVATGATKGNSGIVHGGYAAKHGSLKAALSLAGNSQYDRLSRDLGFPFRRSGSFVLAFSAEEIETLESIRHNGELNGVEDLSIIGADELRLREPRISPRALAALYCPGAGIVSPYEAAIAMSETAVGRGVELLLHAELLNAEPSEDGFRLETSRGSFRASAVVDAAGLYAGNVARMFGEDGIEISPRKGQYVIFQRGSSAGLNSVIFQCPTATSKGVLVTPTTWGNLMVGPNAEDVDNRNDHGTDFETLRGILDTGLKSVPDLDYRKAIRTFSGLRPVSTGRDFIIRRGTVDGLYLAAGIESPGVTAAPAIADMLLAMLREDGVAGPLRKDTGSGGERAEGADIGTEISATGDGDAGDAGAGDTGSTDEATADAQNPVRRPITLPAELLPLKDAAPDVKREPGDPLRIVCRCEQVREETIIDALERPIPIDSMDAVKRRTRAGMGGCQGQFCAPRVRELLHSRLGLETDIIDPHEVDRELIKKIREL